MKWVPLLFNSGGTGISAELVVAFAVTVACVTQTGQTTSFLAATVSRVSKSRFLQLLLAHC
jgi:hypothetical protein